jgi:hypothetical protein
VKSSAVGRDGGLQAGQYDHIRRVGYPFSSVEGHLMRCHISSSLQLTTNQFCSINELLAEPSVTDGCYSQ